MLWGQGAQTRGAVSRVATTAEKVKLGIVMREGSTLTLTDPAIRESKRLLHIEFKRWQDTAAGGVPHGYAKEKKAWIEGKSWRDRDYIPPADGIVRALRIHTIDLADEWSSMKPVGVDLNLAEA